MPALPKFINSAARQNAAADKAVAASTSSPERRGGQPSDAPFHVPDEVVIRLPMPPTTNNLFAGSASGKHRFRTREYNSWIEEAGWLLISQRPPQVRGKVSILIEVEEPSTAREMDLMNREKATTDLLVKHRIIEGDSNRYVRKFAMEWAPIEGVRVTIRPLAHSFAGVGG